MNGCAHRRPRDNKPPTHKENTNESLDYKLGDHNQQPPLHHASNTDTRGVKVCD